MNKRKNKKNLLVLASTYPRWLNDHEPSFVHELSKRLTEKFNVIVACPHAKGTNRYENLENVEVYRYRYAPNSVETLVNDGGIVTNLKKSPWKLLLLPSFFLAQLSLVRKLIKNNNIDVIHAHWLIPQGLVIALLSLFIKIPPVLVTSHGTDLLGLKGAFFNKLKVFVAHKSMHLSVVSKMMKAELTHLGISPKKISVMPMGIDNKLFNESIERERSTNEILFVGRLVEQKGIGLLISAMPEIIKNHPEAHLTIIGFGPYENKLKEQVNLLNLIMKVNFIGALTQEEIVPYYQRAAVFAAPFTEEGLGLVLVEALACGCPIVVSDIPACEDVVEGMHNVTIFPSSDINALAKAVNRSMSEKKIKSVTDIARLTEKFSWQAVAQNYNNKLEVIINHDPRY